eukprot:2999415-Pleurochrysis_carterae.AAC.2
MTAVPVAAEARRRPESVSGFTTPPRPCVTRTTCARDHAEYAYCRYCEGCGYWRYCMLPLQLSEACVCKISLATRCASIFARMNAPNVRTSASAHMRFSSCARERCWVPASAACAERVADGVYCRTKIVTGSAGC